MPLCPRCGGPIGLDTAVCPGCRFAPALGIEVGLAPPRAARSDPDFEMPPLRRTRMRRPWRWWHLALFALVPGLGHYLDWQPRAAAVFACGVMAGVVLAQILPSPTLSILLIALAAGLHAWSILDHTPWRRAELLPRLLVLVLLNLACGCLWSMLLGFGSTFSVARVRAPRGHAPPLFDGPTTLLILFLAIGIGCLIVRWLHQRRS